MLAWESSLELGISVLDAHHQRLIDLANAVAAAIRASVPKDDVIAMLRELAGFAEWHFRFEEELMAAFEPGDRLLHAEQHGELLGQMRRFILKVESGTADELHSAKTFRFLGVWVTHHVRFSDRKMVHQLLERGWIPPADYQI